MYLQGNLQNVFDALYHLGIIDPLLEKDWTEYLNEMSASQIRFDEIVSVVNQHQGNIDVLVYHLEKFDEDALGFLAMEVAREFADFHSRASIQ